MHNNTNKMSEQAEMANKIVFCCCFGLDFVFYGIKLEKSRIGEFTPLKGLPLPKAADRSLCLKSAIGEKNTFLVKKNMFWACFEALYIPPICIDNNFRTYNSGNSTTYLFVVCIF